MTRKISFAAILGTWVLAATLSAIALHYIRIYWLPPTPVVYEIRYVVCRVTAGEPDCETIKDLAQ